MRTLLLLIGAALITCSHAAELLDQNADIKIGADFVEIDSRNDQQHLRGNVLITQGKMSIAANEATGSAVTPENTRWMFEQAVHVKSPDADLRSNTASADFVNGEISKALFKGTPAVFEQRRGTSSDKPALGRAGQIEYNVVKGIVTLTNDVWFSYGGNEFRGNVVVYNVRDERVVVNPGGKSTGRVNITIRPRNGTKSESPSDAEAAPPAQGNGA